MDLKPRISIITPTTFSRSNLLPLLVNSVISQTYPHELLEWVVVGDNDPRTREEFCRIFKDMPSITCNYYECDILDNIGRKRNFACNLAKSRIIANMDSDDFYQKSYLEYSIETMKEKKVTLVGSRDMLVFYPLFHGKMTFIRGMWAHEASIVCTKKHWSTHRYNEVRKGEGVNLVKDKFFNEVDIRKVMICFAHSGNSCKKDSLLDATEVPISEDMRLMLMEMYSMCKVVNS